MRTDKLLSICKDFQLPDPNAVIINDPYIPFVPENWNGVLVLAESQNLSSQHDKYVKKLLSASVTERLERLYWHGDGIGVYPWDDGSLKLAVASALGLDISSTAVSNAVLWSQRGGAQQNINPAVNLQSLSSELWAQMLEVLKPKLIICSGNIADSVVHSTGWTGDRIKLRLPSRTAMSRVSGMFQEEDLLIRYPEVQSVIEKHSGLLDGGYRRNKIFFACHAVSLYRDYYFNL